MNHQDQEDRAPTDAPASMLTPQSTDSAQISEHQSEADVNQLIQDASFTINYTGASEDAGPISATEVECRICYDPATRLCQFTCDTHDIHLDGLTTEETYYVHRRDEQDIQAGKWKLSCYGTESKPVLQALGTFLISIKQVSIDISKNEVAEMPFARSKVSVVVEPCAIEEPETLDKDQVNETPAKKTKANPLKRRFSEMENDQTDEKELDGRVQAQQSTGGAPLTCLFQQNTGEIARSDVAVLFAGYHSILGSVDIVAKVMHYDDESLTRVVESSMREVAILQGLEHHNIMKIHGYDASLLTLYLEGLPPSLETRTKDVHPAIHMATGLMLLPDDAEVPFDETECIAILYDVCSALIHLKERGCFHNNIQPAHIAYSPERGAVLIGFGKATTADNPQFIKCSSWSAPPESLRTRLGSAPGDVWALGIAMLYVLGKINDPEELVQAGSIGEKSLERWLAIVADIRSALDGTRTVECLVYAMLDPDADSRIEAATIEMMLRPHREEDSHEE